MKNKVLGALILISNILFFIPQSVDVIKTNGGAMGFGWIAFPFLIFINLFTIPAILSFLKKNDSNVIFWINLFGVIFIAFCIGYIFR